jgi:hypothetical protein
LVAQTVGSTVPPEDVVPPLEVAAPDDVVLPELLVPSVPEDEDDDDVLEPPVGAGVELTVQAAITAAATMEMEAMMRVSALRSMGGPRYSKIHVLGVTDRVRTSTVRPKLVAGAERLSMARGANAKEVIAMIWIRLGQVSVWDP